MGITHQNILDMVGAMPKGSSTYFHMSPKVYKRIRKIKMRSPLLRQASKKGFKWVCRYS